VGALPYPFPLDAQLAAEGQVATLDLDTIYWEPKQIAVARDIEHIFTDLHKFCKSCDQWIIEGCYGELIEASLVYEPELLFLNPGKDQCVSNCRSRPLERHKYSSQEEQDSKLDFLLQWVRDYYIRDGHMSLVGHQDLFKKYSGPKRELLSFVHKA